ncbi:E3 ubiquitin-protein ligase RHA2A-like [Mercurialis annua]|uniref:E3 ubiquitin-protein ligase RHA2A-like n=1 Tax=Mercurialis annua TaxID=3986 RepID=UPI00215E3DEF|nr:E3 ubiquitin-protein ligase RHA2A-like [Mercurialis annua]
MVLNKLASIIYNLIAPTRQLIMIKNVTSYQANVLDVSEIAKDGGFTSPGGSSSGGALEVESEFCCVCLSRLKGGEKVRVLFCEHKFHKVCIDSWFKVCRKTCPICRFATGEDEGSYKREEQLTEEMVIWFSSFHVAGF